MAEKNYCNKNLQYLCDYNNIALDDLRETLEMSKLQFNALGTRATNMIADYFNITIDEFMHVDLSLPVKYRYLSFQDQKEELCKQLLDSIELEIDA